MSEPSTDGTRPTVAVLGASTDRSKFGNKSVRAHAAAGYRVYPVNLSGGEIEGHAAYRTLAEVPGELDRISVYLPPAVTRTLLDEIAERGAAEVWFNPGSADGSVREAAAGRGIPVRDGCSIVDIGLTPSQFP